jgi:divalent metal cation (Fe/Co/Zn/Cd) transporter
MPDSRLRAASFAAGVVAFMLLPVCGYLVWASLYAPPVPVKVNWWAAVALGVYIVLVAVLTYLTRRGVNLGRGLL